MVLLKNYNNTSFGKIKMSGKLSCALISGSDSENCCLLCNKHFNAGKQSADSTESNPVTFAQKVFRTFDKHLSTTVKGESFCLPHEESYYPAFCESCLKFAVELIRIDKEMEEIQNRLKEFISFLSLEILTTKGLSTFQNLITTQPKINKNSSIEKQHANDHHLQNVVEIAHNDSENNDSETAINTVKTEPDDTDYQQFFEGEVEGDCFHPTEEIPLENPLSVNNNAAEQYVDNRAIDEEKLVKTAFKVEQLADLNPFVKLIDFKKHATNKARRRTTSVETYHPIKRRSAETARKILQNIIQTDYNSSDSEFEVSDDGQTNNAGELYGEDYEDSDTDEHLQASEQDDDVKMVTTDHFDVRKRKRKADQSSELPSKLAKKSNTNSNVRTKNIGKKFKCRECEAAFSFTEDLDQHNEETGHVNEKTFKCKLCEKSYYNSADLRKHSLGHPSGNTKNLTCGICTLELKTLYIFRNHCNSHVGKYFQCNKCLNKFLTQAQRKEHQEKWHSSYSCTLCEKSFTRRLRLENHLKRHEPKPKIKDKKSFVCKVCGEDFAFSKELIQHSEATGHINERKFLCSGCPNSYFRKRDLKFHERVHKPKYRDEKYRFVCQVCKAEFILSKDLLEHSETMGHQNEKSFYCSICPNSYFREVDLQYHERLHIRKNMSDGNNSFVCQVCEADFTLLKELLEHSESTGHKNENNFSCTMCPNSYFREVDLKYHTRLHENKFLSDKKSFVCKVCKVDFAFSEELEEHSETTGHKNEKKYLCSECPFSYFRRVDLKCHLRTHNPCEAYECEYCNKTLQTALAFKNHVARHTGRDASYGEELTEEGFYCDDSKCGKWFKYKQSLIRHTRRGHDHVPLNKEWPCTQCPYISRNKSIFDKHLRTHTGEKPYMCEECGLSYVAQGGLSIHVRNVHMGLRFSCSLCEKTFSTDKSRIDHQIRHSQEEKTFKCKICYEQFPDRKTMGVHQKIHSSQEKRFQCQNCGKGYTKKSRLREHQSKCGAPANQ